MKKFVDFNHLTEVRSGYFKHCFIALYLVAILFVSAFLGLINAIFPFILPMKSYQILKKVIEETEKFFIYHE